MGIIIQVVAIHTRAVVTSYCVAAVLCATIQVKFTLIDI